MPREQITHNAIVGQLVSAPTYGDAQPADAVVHIEQSRRNVHVSWDRTGWLQLGIDVTLAELREMLAQAESAAARAAAAAPDGMEYATEAHQFRVMSDVLDRTETNLAIVTLRRARDVAYGKDA